MAVDDYGIEVLKKAADYEVTGKKDRYILNVKATFGESNLDEFGRIQVAEPFKLLEYSASKGLDSTRYVSTSVTGGGTVTANSTTTQIELATTTASGDQAIFQSRRNVQYNKANAQEIFIIYRPNATANRRERWGYFDANNGAFFEHDGTNPRLVIRSNTSGSPVDTAIERDDWDDPLDGSGASGLTIDFTKQTVFKITIGWLSSRGVRFWVDIGGTFVLIKKYHISNTMTVPFMATAQLPIRFEVTNTGTVASSVTSSFTCYAVQSSGAHQQEGQVRFLTSDTTAFSITTTPTIFAGIRLKSTALNGSVLPLEFSLTPKSGNSYCIYKVLYNPTLTGAVWATPTDGIVDTLTSLTSYTGGSIIATGQIPLTNKVSLNLDTLRQVLSDVYVGRGIDNSRDPLCLVLYTDTSTGEVFFHGSYKEFI